MAAGDEYASVGAAGRLKLKGLGTGVNEGRIEKKKTKKKIRNKEKDGQERDQLQRGDNSESLVTKTSTLATTTTTTTTAAAAAAAERAFSAEDAASPPTTGLRSRSAELDAADELVVGKTEAERRYEEARRKRLLERLKREGVKTHKERVEELNKYLSGLSEHHDMPRIGPG